MTEREKPKAFLPDGWRLGKVKQRQLVAYEDAMREAGKAVTDMENWTAARQQRNSVQAALDAEWFAATTLKAGETADDLEPKIVSQVFAYILSTYVGFISIDPNE